MAYSETTITGEELLNADEIWITSSTWEIVPVLPNLNNMPVGTGEVWPLVANC